MSENNSSRRNFLQQGGAFFAALLSQSQTFGQGTGSSDQNYKVKFTCKTDDKNEPNDFDGERANFERLEKIIEVNDTFLKDGRLIWTTHNKGEHEMSWEYLFKNKAAYKQWNRIIYKSSFFQRSKMPAKYKLDVTEGYA